MRKYGNENCRKTRHTWDAVSNGDWHRTSGDVHDERGPWSETCYSEETQRKGECVNQRNGEKEKDEQE
ncbi:hypothetical protein L3Y34_012730 [Caenorhabditis briggsae]|uniref:Uncharacterized protein n=1 Tax=Caenorhabditis briggsae TaxID=6238 RepID=A0AAE9CW89_CAEBR|nr:hypothetical protein L3Y34_012730 [Caenorhabditis briggsae]